MKPVKESEVKKEEKVFPNLDHFSLFSYVCQYSLVSFSHLQLNEASKYSHFCFIGFLEQAQAKPLMMFQLLWKLWGLQAAPLTPLLSCNFFLLTPKAWFIFDIYLIEI